MKAIEGADPRLDSVDPVMQCLHMAGLDRDLNQLQKKRLAGICIPRRLHSGQVIFRQNERLSSVAIVCEGCVKTSAVLPDGREQVVRLHMPGALLGVEALGEARAVVEAAASGDCEILYMPVRSIDILCHEMPAFHRNLMRAMSHVLVNNHQLMWPLAHLSAHARVSLFLSSLVERASAAHSKFVELGLPASRGECASLLRLRPETFSRELTRLNNAGVLRTSRGAKWITVLDCRGLRRQCTAMTDPSVVLHSGCKEASARTRSCDVPAGTGLQQAASVPHRSRAARTGVAVPA